MNNDNVKYIDREEKPIGMKNEDQTNRLRLYTWQIAQANNQTKTCQRVQFHLNAQPILFK